LIVSFVGRRPRQWPWVHWIFRSPSKLVSLGLTWYSPGQRSEGESPVGVGLRDPSDDVGEEHVERLRIRPVLALTLDRDEHAGDRLALNIQDPAAMETPFFRVIVPMSPRFPLGPRTARGHNPWA